MTNSIGSLYFSFKCFMFYLNRGLNATRALNIHDLSLNRFWRESTVGEEMHEQNASAVYKMMDCLHA